MPLTIFALVSLLQYPVICGIMVSEPALPGKFFLKRLLDTHLANSYNNFCAEVAQLVEQRTENPRLGMPTSAISFKIEPLCQLLKPCFEAKVLFGDILSFLVCRQNVAKIGAPFTGRLPWPG